MRMNIILLIVIRNSYVSLIRYSVIPPLPHQLDLRTGQLWANGRSTLQLHQQKSTPLVSGSLITAVVIPPDSEVVAKFSISGGQLGACALMDPNWDLTEQYGVLVGHTLVDATTPSASVLIINPNAEEVVFPCGSSIGDLVPVLSVSMARSMEYLSETTTENLPEYLEDIVRGLTLPWEIPVVSPCVIYSTNMNMCFRHRGNQ